MQVEKKQQRAKRSDAGIARQTGRDAVLMEWMAHMYGVPIDLLQHHLGVGDVRMRDLVRRWVGAGWMRKGSVDAGAPWLWPVRNIQNQFLGWETKEWAPRPTTAAHTRAVAAVRMHQMGFDLTRWVSERDLLHEHGWRLKDEIVSHMPDGVEILPDGSKVMIEVELTAKTRTRYVEERNQFNNAGGLIQDIQLRASDLGCSRIAYWCAPNVLPLVKEAVGEYQSRRDRERRQATRPEDMAREKDWFFRNLEEVPRWGPRD